MHGTSLLWRSTVAFTYLEVKSAKCIFYFRWFWTWSWSCYFGLGLVYITVNCVCNCVCSQVCQLGLDWFLPRDAERKRGLCCFLNPAAPPFQFFWSQATIPSSKENPFIGRGVKYTGVGIKFRLKSPFISETLRDMLIWLLYNVNKKSPVADRYVSVPVTLSDLERWDVWPRPTWYGRITHVEGRIKRRSGTPIP